MLIRTSHMLIYCEFCQCGLASDFKTTLLAVLAEAAKSQKVLFYASMTLYRKALHLPTFQKPLIFFD